MKKSRASFSRVVEESKSNQKCENCVHRYTIPNMYPFNFLLTF